MRIVGTNASAVDVRRVHCMSNVSWDETVVFRDEDVIAGTSVRRATKRVQLVNVMSYCSGGMSWRNVVVDTQFGFRAWVLTLLVIAVPAAAQEAPSSAMRTCFGEQDASRRLACYDAEVGRLINGGRVAEPPKPGRGAEQFGVDGALLQKRLKEGTQPPEPHQLTEHVAAVTHRSNGEVVVRLANNQVWEQSEDGPDLRIEVGDSVKIDKGMLGSYWLSAHSSLVIKVRRTQ